MLPLGTLAVTNIFLCFSPLPVRFHYSRTATKGEGHNTSSKYILLYCSINLFFQFLSNHWLVAWSVRDGSLLFERVVSFVILRVFQLQIRFFKIISLHNDIRTICVLTLDVFGEWRENSWWLIRSLVLEIHWCIHILWSTSDHLCIHFLLSLAHFSFQTARKI